MTSLISAVMPTYNRGDSFLKSAVESVLRQTWKNFELIIIDDASTDSTESTIESFGDKRIIYKKTDHNHGEYWSTNYGISMSTGKYLTWIHSDDLLPPNSLELRATTFEKNTSLDFVHGDIMKIDENGKEIETLLSTDQHGVQVFQQYIVALKEGNMAYLVHHTTIMMKRNFFYKAGPFDASLPFAGDIDWMLRALRIGSYQRIPNILYQYRKHNQARTATDIQSGVDKISVRKIIASRYI